MSPFYESCYKVLKKVPKGEVTTYREIARALNSKAYRAVGSAMHNNPYAPVVPCHRCINSNGNVGGFFSGAKDKIKLLKSEGVEVINNKIDLKKYFYRLK
jgi:methylated-DNA-[protein]-cysteine S-methyltransferase